MSFNLSATDADLVNPGQAPNTLTYAIVSSTQAGMAVTVNKADATAAYSGFAGGTYDGSAHTQTVTVTGVETDGQLYTTSLSGINAGSYSQAWSFANTNYNLGCESCTLAFAIAKADATVNVTGYTGTYDALAHGATGTATGVAGPICPPG